MKRMIKDALSVISSKKYPILTTVLLTGVSLSYQNCESDGYAAIAGSTTSISVDTPIDNGETLCSSDASRADLICNPLGGGTDKGNDIPSVPVRKLGLIAKLYEGEADWNDINRYPSGYEHPEKIYFSNFNVPVRAFDLGFSNGDSYLKNRDGDRLIEWFSISARGFITLPANESDGYYEIVTMSDDGVKVSVDDELIINAPGTQSPRMMCATSLIHLKKDELKKFQLDYFQGPRVLIALMTFIKKVDDPASYKAASFCSQYSDNFTMLLDSGYKVISPAYFVLPDDI